MVTRQGGPGEKKPLQPVHAVKENPGVEAEGRLCVLTSGTPCPFFSLLSIGILKKAHWPGDLSSVALENPGSMFSSV